VLVAKSDANHKVVLLTETELWTLLEGHGLRSWDDVAQFYKQADDEPNGAQPALDTTLRLWRTNQDLLDVLLLSFTITHGSALGSPKESTITERILKDCCDEIRKSKNGGKNGSPFLACATSIAAGIVRMQNRHGAVNEDALNCVSFAHLLQKQYEEVLACVRILAKSEDDEFRVMAYCRGGDAFLAQKNYQIAALYYWKAIGINSGRKDGKMHAYAVQKLEKIASHEDVSLHVEEASYDQVSDAAEVRLTEQEYRTYVAEKHKAPLAHVNNPRGMDPKKRMRIVSLPLNPPLRYTRTPSSPVITVPYNMPRNLSWLIPGVLMGSSTPRNATDIVLLKHLFNISHVVTLTEEEPLDGSWFSHVDGVENLFLPTLNYEPPTVEQVDQFLKLMEARQGPVLVHCGGGKGRAGCFLAAYLLRFGLDPPPAGLDACEVVPSSSSSSSSHPSDRKNEEEAEKKALDCHVEAPALNAQEAVDMIRAMRPGSLETEHQERFVRRYSQKLWSRLEHPKHVVPEPSEPLAWHHGSAPPTGSSFTPSVIICSGLPCSGKSWFASQLSVHGGYTRVCQDECEGSRDMVESTFGRVVAGKHKAVLDRCNPSPEDRANFLSLAFKPSDALSVHFTASPSVCKERLRLRKNHPTLVGSAIGDRVIDSFAKSMAEPGKKEGFATYCSVPSFHAARELLRRLGVTASDEDEQENWRRLNNNNKGKASNNQQQGGDMENNCATQSTVTKEEQVVEESMIKFPRTRHLMDLGGTAVTRDDLLMDSGEIARLLAPVEGQRVTLEEKVDGANMGLSYKSDVGTIVVQNRSHYVNSKSQSQFCKLDMWLDRHREELFALCTESREDGTLARSRILYGEWCYAKHSIPYDLLPDYFIAFDIYDIAAGKFYSRARFHATMDALAPTMSRVPTIEADADGDLKSACLNLKSAFRSGAQNAEGVYLRVDRDEWLHERAKIVRPDFICGDVHWSKHNVTKNLIDHRKQNFG